MHKPDQHDNTIINKFPRKLILSIYKINIFLTIDWTFFSDLNAEKCEEKLESSDIKQVVFVLLSGLQTLKLNY